MAVGAVWAGIVSRKFPESGKSTGKFSAEGLLGSKLNSPALNGHSYQPLFHVERQTPQDRVTPFSCRFKWSMQHLISNCREEDVAYEIQNQH